MPGTSTKLKSQHMGVELSDYSQQFLQKMDKDFQYKQNYELQPHVKARRLEKSAEKLGEHKMYKDLHKKEPEYKKGQLDRKLPELMFHIDYCKQRLPSHSTQ